MNRRGFLASILAAGVAPAIVRADSLMRVIPTSTTVALPTLSVDDIVRGAPLMQGELGQYNGVRFHGAYASDVGKRVWAESLWKSVRPYATGDRVRHQGEDCIVIVPAANSLFYELLGRKP